MIDVKTTIPSSLHAPFHQLINTRIQTRNPSLALYPVMYGVPSHSSSVELGLEYGKETREVRRIIFPSTSFLGSDVEAVRGLLACYLE